jgi:ubiquinone/menaquinone biosynthesis C-methylase UbiE
MQTVAGQGKMEEKKAIQEAFTEMSSNYEEVIDGELNLFWGWSYHNFLEQLIKHTTFEEDQRILDIATGTLVIPRKILEQNLPGIKITGLDLTESMLRKGQQKLNQEGIEKSIDLTCADAMALPYADGSFDLVVSGLASHHMNIPLMLSEMKRVIKPGGKLSIIDVGTSPLWDTGIIKFFLRIYAFFFFLIRENLTRARAEISSVDNLRTPQGWENELARAGFSKIKIIKLKSKNNWAPEPLSIQSSF